MTSGIYQLTFADGSSYVGKSNDIPRRLMEHRKKLLGGTAASKLQACYGRCGLPDETILVECHADHIDLLETMYINLLKPKLNTAPTSYIAEEDVGVLSDCDPDLLAQSTGRHIALITEFASAIVELSGSLIVANQKRTEEELATELGRQLYAARRALDHKATIVNELTTELLKLRNRSLWQRIFNL